MNLKIGGSNVGKIMYGGQEFGGATKLEPGTIFYMSEPKGETTIESIHLPSTTKNWNNINGINVELYDDKFLVKCTDADIPSDDFKNSYIIKSIKYGSDLIQISISIVDGEYRLNITSPYNYIFIVKAI